MSSCVNCGRSIDTRGGLLTGPLLFCSPMCRDTSEELRRYQQMKAAERRLPKPTFLEQCDAVRDELIAQGVNIRASEFLRDDDGCGVPGCFVCSGAMRERKGDANG